MRSTSSVPVMTFSFFFFFMFLLVKCSFLRAWSSRSWARCGGTPLHSNISVGFAGDYNRPVGWASHSLGMGRQHPLALGSDLALFGSCSLETSAPLCCSSSESTSLSPLPLQTLLPGAMPAVVQDSHLSTGELLSDRRVVMWDWAYLSLLVCPCVLMCPG